MDGLDVLEALDVLEGWRAGGLEKPELPEKTELLVKKWNKHG